MMSVCGALGDGQAVATPVLRSSIPPNGAKTNAPLPCYTQAKRCVRGWPLSATVKGRLLGE